MNLDKNLSVSDKQLDELKNMSSASLKDWIDKQPIFTGVGKKKKEQIKVSIYGKIKPKRTNSGTSEGEKTNSKRNRKNRSKKQGSKKRES